jgi:hypothetical protein
MKSHSVALSEAMRQYRFAREHRAVTWLFPLFVSLTSFGCGARVEPIDPANSQTHWLEGCSTNAECGDLECLCGICTTVCTDDAQCDTLDTAAVCGTGGDRCAALTSSAVCVLSCTNDDGCSSGNTCVNGSCTVTTPPSGTQAAGAACDVDEDCASGTCAGPGCEPFSGVCAGQELTCGKSVREYCGCDNVTFSAASDCPGQRYAYAGSCDSTSEDDAGLPVSPTGFEVGAPCSTDEECASGACRTETCFAADARCVAPTQTTCLDNIVQFCGCDGVTVIGSSGGYGCAPAPYAYVGACRGGNQPAGGHCDVDADCASGTCEGMGCGPYEGVCADNSRDCTEDEYEYCGCDGTVFQSSSSCAGARYTYTEECRVPPTEEECAPLPETECGVRCYPIYGIEPDGSQEFVACSAQPLTTLEAFACALSPDGQLRSLPPSHVPNGWTLADQAACTPDCFSPFRNVELAKTPNAVGCECTSVGSACIEGVGMECMDGTDDLDPTRYWQLQQDVCNLDCDGGSYTLQACVDRYQSCAQGGIVLDKGTPVYCGVTPIECGLRDEAGCNYDCTPKWGTSRDGSRVYAGCFGPEEVCGNEVPETYCLQRLTPQTLVPQGDVVLTQTCTVPSGWATSALENCVSAGSAECLAKSQEECNAPCGVRYGRRSSEAEGEFIGCDYEECSSEVVVCAMNAEGDLVEFFGCALSGWSEVDSGLCQQE